MSEEYKQEQKRLITEAWAYLRTHTSDTPDELLDLMKDLAIGYIDGKVIHPRSDVSRPDGWRSVNELPEEEGEYLVTCGFYGFPDRQVTTMCFEGGNWVTPENGTPIINECYAWKPLPKPYEESK